MKNIITFISKNYFSIQSIVLWIVAILNVQEYTFWFFAITAIIVGGIGDILDELRKQNKKELNETK